MRSTNFSTVSALTCVFKSVRLSLSNERRHSVAPTLLPALICRIKTVIVGLRLKTRSWPCV